ncbi:MAG: class I SAM-dependent rRNA methyltransferase [Actinomycetota bacterium]
MNVLDSLPRPAETRLALRVTPDAVRRLRGGHPWLFDGSIISVSREGAAGDLAVIFDDDRRFVAIGLWDPESPIRVKVLHQGKPVAIDADWFRGRLAEAVARRRTLAESAGTPTATTGYRVVHGENDGLPGLVLDRYGHVAVLKLYSAAWVPHLSTLVPLIIEALPSRSLVLRLARQVQVPGLHEGLSLFGPPVVEAVPFTEHGLHFEADVVRGQKTGHFLDQRDNRIRVGSMATGARVLDLFSCNGGFSVHAAAGGATSVHSVDSSPFAIEAARTNMLLNATQPAVAACRYDTTVGEAFGVMERLAAARTRFDIVVIDPPSFASNALAVPKAITAYQRLTTLGLALVERDGLLVQASCSSRVTEPDFARAVHTAAAAAGYDLEEVARTGHALDHPIGFPEGGYLKAIFARPHRIKRP